MYLVVQKLIVYETLLGKSWYRLVDYQLRRPIIVTCIWFNRRMLVL